MLSGSPGGAVCYLRFQERSSVNRVIGDGASGQFANLARKLVAAIARASGKSGAFEIGQHLSRRNRVPLRALMLNGPVLDRRQHLFQIGNALASLARFWISGLPFSVFTGERTYQNDHSHHDFRQFHITPPASPFFRPVLPQDWSADPQTGPIAWTTIPPVLHHTLFHGARFSRLRSLFASASPMNSSFAGFHLSGRRSQ